MWAVFGPSSCSTFREAKFLERSVSANCSASAGGAHRLAGLVQYEAQEIRLLLAGQGDFFIRKQIDAARIVGGEECGDDGILQAGPRILLVKRLDQDIARIEIHDGATAVILCVFHIFLLLGQFHFLGAPLLADFSGQRRHERLEVPLDRPKVPQ
jgi:hypothetical protein